MIGLFGLNHKSAPIEIREKFVFCEEDIKRFVPQLKAKGILERLLSLLVTAQRFTLNLKIAASLQISI